MTAESEPDATDIWVPDMLRAFLSHSAVHKRFVHDVADALHTYGIDGFVAHDSIEVTKEWQSEIERALRTADMLVGFVHPEFTNSAWANQEVGWAYGREIPVFMVRLGADPLGFPSKFQWPDLKLADAEDVAARIAQLANSDQHFSDKIAGALIAALREARNYYEAGDAAEALNNFDALTPGQFADLDQAYLLNDQVHGGVLAHRGLEPLYKRHRRPLPTVPSPPSREGRSLGWR